MIFVKETFRQLHCFIKINEHHRRRESRVFRKPISIRFWFFSLSKEVSTYEVTKVSEKKTRTDPWVIVTRYDLTFHCNKSVKSVVNLSCVSKMYIYCYNFSVSILVGTGLNVYTSVIFDTVMTGDQLLLNILRQVPFSFIRDLTTKVTVFKKIHI